MTQKARQGHNPNIREGKLEVSRIQNGKVMSIALNLKHKTSIATTKLKKHG